MCNMKLGTSTLSVIHSNVHSNLFVIDLTWKQSKYPLKVVKINKSQFFHTGNTKPHEMNELLLYANNMDASYKHNFG